MKQKPTCKKYGFVVPATVFLGLVLSAWIHRAAPGDIQAWLPLGLGGRFGPVAAGIVGATELKLAPVLLAIFILSTLLLLLVSILHMRKRSREMEAERARYIEACSLDDLTGFFNKAGFEDMARKQLNALPADRICMLAAFEVASFRAYKELYGYVEGDKLLLTIAELIRELLREGDVAARFYSDHFVWLISGNSNEAILSVLRQLLESAKSHDPSFSLCGGIYLVRDRSTPVAEMVEKASVAKDLMKADYKTGITIYSESMLEMQLQDAAMAANMMKGLQNGEFVEYYQPKYSTDTETIIGAEALVRWKKPDGELVVPGKFIALFERNGFIRKLDFYVFERVCRFLAESKAAGLPVLPVSVNFSRVHMHDWTFPQRLHKLAQKYGAEPRNLEIELTESAFIMDTAQQRKLVDSIRRYGFTVSIDDFGSGYSSLNMLKDFEVDTLKIDTKFLEGFEHGGKVGTVVTSVIRMAKWLGLPVVAEGVETREQVDFLRSLGCEMIQGFFYSTPMPREDYEKLLEQQNTGCLQREKATLLTIDRINEIMGGDNLITTLLEGILGGFAIYELDKDRLEVIRVNRAYYDLMGYPDASAFSGHSRNVLTQVHPEDAKKLIEKCILANTTSEVQSLSIRRYRYDGTLIPLDCQIKHIGGSSEKPIICMVFRELADAGR